jgi:hypothetical protein
VIESSVRRGRFLGVAIVRPATGPVFLAGPPEDLPPLSPAWLAHLDAGRTLLVTSGPPTARRILFARRVTRGDPGHIVWARLNPAYLWAGGNRDAVAGEREVCVLDEENFFLDCSSATARAAGENMPSRLSGRYGGDIDWAADERQFVGAFWPASIHLYRPVETAGLGEVRRGAWSWARTEAMS